MDEQHAIDCDMDEDCTCGATARYNERMATPKKKTAKKKASAKKPTTEIIHASESSYLENSPPDQFSALLRNIADIVKGRQAKENSVERSPVTKTDGTKVIRVKIAVDIPHPPTE